MIGDELAEAVINGEVTYHDAVQFFSRSLISAALHFHEGNIAATSRSLGVKRTSLSLMIARRLTLKSIVRRGIYQRRKRVRKVDKVCEECGCVLTSQACFGCLAISESIYIASIYTSESDNYSAMP